MGIGMGKAFFGLAAMMAFAAPLAAHAQGPEALGLDALGQVESRYIQLNVGAGVGGESKSRFETPGVFNGRIKTDLDVGPALSGLVGQGYTSGLAFEVEGVYLQNQVDSDAVNQISPFDLKTKMAGGFANVKYEMVNPSPLFPYVAAGLGYGETTYRVFGDNGHSDGVLWQLKAGVAIPATDDVTVDLGYRFVRSPDYETTDRILYQGQTYDATFKAATQVHVLTAGVRWAF
jgi:opacity protein-like surface antigen